MEKLSDSLFKQRIEDLKESKDYEQEGDRLFLNHPKKEARLLWAFYRPSGSHPSQIEDKDLEVSAMAFNHSRLTPLKRIQKLPRDLLTKEHIIKINNRMRMLFRSLVDSDFKELVAVLREFPSLSSYAIHQVIYGRRILEVDADVEALSQFLEIVGLDNPQVIEAVFERVVDFEQIKIQDLKEFLHLLKHKKIHPVLLEYIRQKLDEFSDKHSLHTLQRKRLQTLLKEATFE